MSDWWAEWRWFVLVPLAGLAMALTAIAILLVWQWNPGVYIVD